ncbi:hypothetical protein [Rhizobium sp.]|uniref:hypothetical protein n=1 Tax=Rhizobium sp. TaxID=391 RepID=UPI0028B25AC6
MLSGKTGRWDTNRSPESVSVIIVADVTVLANRYPTIIGEQMPFFLVTHRSLVEADSEHGAAVKALEKLDRGRKLEFEVKFDEATITSVVVERNPDDSRSSSTETLSPDRKLRDLKQPSSDAGQPDPQHGENLSRPATPDRPSSRTATLVAIFLGGLVLTTFLFGAL